MIQLVRRVGLGGRNRARFIKLGRNINLPKDTKSTVRTFFSNKKTINVTGEGDLFLLRHKGKVDKQSTGKMKIINSDSEDKTRFFYNIKTT